MSSLSKYLLVGLAAFALGFLTDMLLMPVEDGSDDATTEAVLQEVVGESVRLRPTLPGQAVFAWDAQLDESAESGVLVDEGGLVAVGRIARVRNGALVPCRPPDIPGCTPVEPLELLVGCWIVEDTGTVICTPRVKMPDVTPGLPDPPPEPLPLPARP